MIGIRHPDLRCLFAMDHLNAARDLHRRLPIVDAHCDTVDAYPHRDGYTFDLGGMKDTHLDLPRLRTAGVDAQVFAAFVHPRYAPAGGFLRAADLIGRIRQQADHYPDALAIADRPGSLRRILGEGRIAAVISIEGGYAIDHDLRKLAALHSLGARLFGLTWNSNTGWADGCGEEHVFPPVGGLSSFGRDVVRELERLGILLDLAHASPATVDAVIEVASRPVADTHACARALMDHRRNLTDDQLRAIAATGGVVGVCFCGDFLAPEGKADVSTLADHLDHMINIAGEDHIGLGSDFDGIRKLPAGLEDASRLPCLTAELLRRGYAESTLAKILGANWMRLLEHVAGL